MGGGISFLHSKLLFVFPLKFRHVSVKMQNFFVPSELQKVAQNCVHLMDFFRESIDLGMLYRHDDRGM